MPLIIAGCSLVASVAEAEMELSFTWGDIPLCTSGHPNIVPNPEFVLTDMPEGTLRVEFKLTDLDVPLYHHGGGSVAITSDGHVPPGAFTYKSPCPPGGVHTYEWQAKAMGHNGVLAIAKARRPYPE